MLKVKAFIAYCVESMTHSTPKTNPKVLTRNLANDFALKLWQTTSKLYSTKTLYLQRCCRGCPASKKH